MTNRVFVSIKQNCIDTNNLKKCPHFLISIYNSLKVENSILYFQRGMRVGLFVRETY